MKVMTPRELKKASSPWWYLGWRGRMFLLMHMSNTPDRKKRINKGAIGRFVFYPTISDGCRLESDFLDVEEDTVRFIKVDHTGTVIDAWEYKIRCLGYDNCPVPPAGAEVTVTYLVAKTELVTRDYRWSSLQAAEAPEEELNIA